MDRSPAPPPADRVLDAESVARLRSALVAEPGIDLAAVHWRSRPRLRAEGWDTALWEVGQMPCGRVLVLRVARRELAVPLLATEMTVLRHLAGWDLPLRVPRPLAVTDAAVLQEWVPGRTAADADEETRREMTVRLAGMLAALHRPPGIDLPRSRIRGCPLSERDLAFRVDLDRIDLPARAEERARATWECGLATAPWRGPDLLLHGDPHPANLVVAEDGPPVLIDFGDAASGDPAGDLGALALFGEDAAALSGYRERAAWPGAADDDVWTATCARARAWTARYALAMLTAHAADDGIGRLARLALDRL